MAFQYRRSLPNRVPISMEASFYRLAPTPRITVVGEPFKKEFP